MVFSFVFQVSSCCGCGPWSGAHGDARFKWWYGDVPSAHLSFPCLLMRLVAPAHFLFLCNFPSVESNFSSVCHTHSHHLLIANQPWGTNKGEQDTGIVVRKVFVQGIMPLIEWLKIKICISVLCCNIHGPRHYFIRFSLHLLDSWKHYITGTPWQNDPLTVDSKMSW